MTQIKNFNYSENEVSMIIVDTTNGQYLWVGFKSDGSNCALQKLSANEPTQKYYDIDLAVSEIKKGYISSSYIYLALSDSALIGRSYSLNNPLTVSVDFALPVGISEAPIDVLVNTNVYFLIPGVVSGTNTKIVEMTIAGVYVQTIDLSTVNNATSFCISDADEFWVTTNEVIAEYVRVYPISGGGYNYTINT